MSEVVKSKSPRDVILLLKTPYIFSRPDLEPIDLQLDYWIADGSGSGANASGSGTGQGSRSGLESRSDSKREFGLGGSGSNNSGKASIKTSVWFMQVMKLGVPSSSGEQPTFTMHYWLKEKKQKSNNKNSDT